MAPHAVLGLMVDCLEGHQGLNAPRCGGPSVACAYGLAVRRSGSASGSARKRGTSSDMRCWEGTGCAGLREAAGRRSRGRRL